MIMRTPELEAAFLATTYRVDTPQGRFDLRIGIADAAFDAFLTRQRASSWAIVSACNPGGVLTLVQNAARHGALRARIEALRWRHWPASNHADSGEWPVEPGFCIVDADEAVVRGLAADFAQAAIVCGAAGHGGGRLVWIRSPGSQ
jgi:hypothetical protein